MIFKILILGVLLFAGIPQVNAGIFDSLFGHKESKSDVVIEEEKVPKSGVIVEEETISADEYMDSSQTPENDQIFDNQQTKESAETIAVPEEKAISDEDFESDNNTFDETLIKDPFIKVRNILLSYTDKPDKIYLLQHFPIHLKAIIPQTNIKAIQTDFKGGKDFKVLNPDTPWRKSGDNSYENTYYLKLLTQKAKLPNIKVTNQSLNGNTHSEILKAFRTKIVALRKDTLFCNVLANNLSLNKHQERKYDEDSNIVVLEMNATQGNLEDFHIPFASREGIDDIKTDGLKQKIYYFSIVNNSKKIFKFKYFDLLKNRFEIISFDIRPIDTSISTHTNLNPRKNKYIFYKKVAFAVIAALFILLFLKYKKWYYLLLALTTIVLLFYTQVPITKAKVPAHVPLRILPMQNSTIFFTTAQPLEVDILLKKKEYTKVLLPNKKIGWIKNEDIR